MRKTALITGVTGQDGSYLTEFLLEKNYEIHGIVRRASTVGTFRLQDVLSNNEKAERVHLHHGDLEDLSMLTRIINEVKPDEIYNLGCQSNVKVSFEVPDYTCQVAAIGFLRLLEAVRLSKLEKHTKVYQASSSEMYGDNPSELKTELSTFSPCSPYGISKVFSHHMARVYRESYGMFISCGILFNHESPRRHSDFVTRKITKAVANIKNGKQSFVELGNLYSFRDWGHAKDYVEAMWLMLQQRTPEDYVIATQECISVKEFVIRCFNYIGMPLVWKGERFDEVGLDSDGFIRVKVDKAYFREKEVPHLKGDFSKAKHQLKWAPKHNIDELIRDMMEWDLNKPVDLF